jgi:hypothetical protein
MHTTRKTSHARIGRTLRATALAGVVATGATASAASAQVLPRRAGPDSTPSGVSWQFDQCMAGLTYGAPYKWALAYGMGYVRESPTSDWCVLSTAKVGLGGASINVGLANSLGHFGSGAALTLGLLRTFEDPLGATPRRSYIGASLHLWPIIALGGEVGIYTRIGTDPAGLTSSRHMVTWSTGFGF